MFGKSLERGSPLIKKQKNKTWKVMGRTVCLSHSKRTNQMCQLSQLETRLPTGARGHISCDEADAMQS